MSKDVTEQILIDVYNGWVDQLKGMKKGSAEAQRVVAKLVRAKRELDDYRRSKKK